MNKITYYILGFTLFINLTSCIPIRNYSFNKVDKNLGAYYYYFEGIQRRLYGDIQNAIVLQNNSLKIDPTNSASFYELSLCYGMLSDYENAINNLENAINLEPQNKYYHHYLGILYLQSKQPAKALENQLKLVSLDPKSINYNFSLALMYKDAGNLQKAITILDSITYYQGFVPQISDARIKILFEQNRLDDVKLELEKLIIHFPDNPIYYLYNSELNFRLGEDSIAFLSLDKALEFEPDNSYIKINKYIHLKEKGLAQESFNLLIDIFSDTTLIVDEKTELFYPLLFEKINYTKYISSLDTLVNILKIHYDQNIQVNEIIYEHNINKQNFHVARSALSRILELDKSNSLIWERVISFDYTFGNIQSAIIHSQKAIERFPEKSLFYILKSLALDNINETALAIVTLTEGGKKTKKDPPGQSEIYGTLADLYYKQKEVSKAFKYFKYSLKANPDNARVLNNYSYYLSLRKQKLSKALQMSSRAVDLEPNNSTYIDTKGWVLFQMGNYQEAKEVLRNAISKSGSTSAVITEHYADALYLSGNKESAYIYWLKAKEIGGGSEKLLRKIETKTYIP